MSIVGDCVEGDPDHFKRVDRQMQHRIVSMVCVPLTIKHETIGVMQILNKRSGNDTARDRMLLEQFANQGGCG